MINTIYFLIHIPKKSEGVNYVYFNNTALRIAKEIEEFVTVKKKEDGAFDAIGFTNKVEHTRLTTHMDLQKAFEYERNKQI